MAQARILVVEDAAITAEYLREKLEELGYEVVEVVDSGEDAVAVAAKNALDLILMDINLRGPLDGTEAACAIQAIQEVPVVFLTAYSDEATLQRAKLAGPLGYLVKPIDLKELNAAITMALYKHGLERQLREAAQAREVLIAELQQALQEIKTLRGLIPICSNCKKIRDDAGYWQDLETYVEARTDAEFSHGMCQECGEALYGEVWREAMKQNPS